MQPPSLSELFGRHAPCSEFVGHFPNGVGPPWLPSMPPPFRAAHSHAGLLPSTSSSSCWRVRVPSCADSAGALAGRRPAVSSSIKPFDCDQTRVRPCDSRRDRRLQQPLVYDGQAVLPAGTEVHLKVENLGVAGMRMHERGNQCGLRNGRGQADDAGYPIHHSGNSRKTRGREGAKAGGFEKSSPAALFNSSVPEPPPFAGWG